MRRLLVGVALILTATGSAFSTPAVAKHATIFQVSTLDALMAGGFDGQTELGVLEQHGTIGLGTFHELDGEMVLLDKKVYQVRSDGHVIQVQDVKMTTPFAVTIAFEPDRQAAVTKPMNLTELQSYLDTLRPATARYAVFRIHGTFDQMKTRSVPRQHKPYPVLAEVIKTQPVFEFTAITGTLVGLWSPVYLKSITGSGYHFHFISDDHRAGGHVLALQLREGSIAVEAADELDMLLPTVPPAPAVEAVRVQEP
jgi:acetolactate decarboxylase